MEEKKERDAASMRTASSLRFTPLSLILAITHPLPNPSWEKDFLSFRLVSFYPPVASLSFLQFSFFSPVPRVSGQYLF